MEIELSLRQGAAPPEPDKWWGRRATLAEVSRQIEPDVSRKFSAELAVATYTLLRIAANLWMLSLIQARSADVLDSVLRPLVTGFGVYCFVCWRDHYSERSMLHVWSRRVVYCLASPHLDSSGLILLACYRYLSDHDPCASHYLSVKAMDALIIPWEALCNIIQMHMTNVKLRVLGCTRTAKCCEVLVAVLSGATVLNVVLRFAELKELDLEKFQVCFLISLVATLVIQFGGMFGQARKAISAARGDHTIRCTAWCLYLNSFCLVAGPLLSILGYAAFTSQLYGTQFSFVIVTFSVSPGQLYWFTVDVGLQVLNALVLSGMMSPAGWDRPEESFKKLADLSGFGLSSKRIAFPGKINAEAKDCIVSFPGKYSQQWDEAVSIATSQQNACSLACVFLTDLASGLGKHSENPNTPDQCWCHVLYGYLPADAYLSIVDMAQHSAQELAFKRADAEAMGQRLLVKSGQTEIDWHAELSEALHDAGARCRENSGRAPWGCQWFEEWRKNVDKAVQLKQALHVFYFEGRVGAGKMSWHQLCNHEAKERARKGSGLGASQTAEVAYLEALRLRYLEHDISEFKTFMVPAEPG